MPHRPPGASPTHEFIAQNARVTYSISPGELVVTAGGAVFKQEPMIDYRDPGVRATPPNRSVELVGCLRGLARPTDEHARAGRARRDGPRSVTLPRPRDSCYLPFYRARVQPALLS